MQTGGVGLETPLGNVRRAANRLDDAGQQSSVTLA